MGLLPDPDDDEAAGRGLPIGPIEARAQTALIDRIERLINERHTHLVDSITALLDQNRQVVVALHEDITGLGVGQENINQQLEQLRADVRTAIAERNAAIAQLRRELDELRGRVIQLEQALAESGD